MSIFDANALKGAWKAPNTVRAPTGWRREL